MAGNLDPNVRRRNGSFRRCKCNAGDMHTGRRRPVREGDRFKTCQTFPRRTAQIQIRQCYKCGKLFAEPTWSGGTALGKVFKM